jgi:phage gp36-like protein
VTRYAFEQDLYDCALPASALPSSWSPTERTRRVNSALDDASDLVDSYLRKQTSVPLGGAVMSPAGVTHAGTGPTVLVSGTPDAARSFMLLIGFGGAPGVATFNWSLNGGASWEETDVVLTEGAYALGTTGLSVDFPDGTYVQWDTYLWNTTGWPRAIKRATCIIAAYDLLAGRGFDPESGTDAIIVERYRQIIKWLEAVAADAVEVLDIDDTTDADGDGEIDEPRGAGIVESQPRRGWGEC